MKFEANFERLNSGEVNSRTFSVEVEELADSQEVRMGFVTPMGKVYISEVLTLQNGKCEYVLPGGLLDGKGLLLAQLLVSKDDVFVKKSPVCEFPVYASVDDMSCPAVSDETLKSLCMIFDMIDKKSDIGHRHDDIYYTQEKTNSLLKNKSEVTHNHSGVYLTADEIEDLIGDVNAATHDHDELYYRKAEITQFLSQKSNLWHSHTGVYATVSEMQNLTTPKIYTLNLNLDTLALTFTGSDTAAGLYASIQNHENIIIRALTSNGTCLYLTPTFKMGVLNVYFLECVSGSEGLFSYTWSLSQNGIGDCVKQQIADYIVDEGTSGMWTYRKWASGAAECWGVHNTTYTTTMASNGNYAVSGDLNLTFPTGLFLASGVCTNLTALGGGYPDVVISQYTGGSGLTFRLRTEWAVSDMGIWLQCQVRGKWK